MTHVVVAQTSRAFSFSIPPNPEFVCSLNGEIGRGLWCLPEPVVIKAGTSSAIPHSTSPTMAHLVNLIFKLAFVVAFLTAEASAEYHNPGKPSRLYFFAGIIPGLLVGMSRFFTLFHLFLIYYGASCAHWLRGVVEVWKTYRGVAEADSAGYNQLEARLRPRECR